MLYYSGIQKKLDKGLRPGTITQGVLSMTKKVPVLQLCKKIFMKVDEIKC